MQSIEGTRSTASAHTQPDPMLSVGAQGRLVTRLPSDVYALLFSTYAEIYPPTPGAHVGARNLFDPHNAAGELAEPDWLNGRGGDLGWIKLAAVCRSWRRAIYDLPNLWAGDIGALPQALDDMLARAGPTCPIRVRVYGSSFRGDPSLVWNRLHTTYPHIRSRIVALEYTETRVDELFVNGFYTFLQNGVFPRLEEIEIFANETQWDNDDPLHPVPRFDTPSLRTLVLTNVTFIPSATALTVLDLTVVEYPVFPSPWLIHPAHLREIFQLCRESLVTLCLNIIVLHLNERDAYLDEKPIEFTALEYIHYIDPLFLTPDGHPIMIFTWITYKSSTKIFMRLETSDDEGAAEDTTSVFTALERAGTPQPSAVSISKEPSSASHNHTILDIMFGHATAIEGGYPRTSEPYLVVTLQVPNTASLQTEVIKSIVRRCDTALVRVLRIIGFSMADITLPFSIFLQVEVLVFDSETVNHYISWLSHRSYEGSLILPRLRSLTLCGPHKRGLANEDVVLRVRDLVTCLASRVHVTALPILNAPLLPEPHITTLIIDRSVTVDSEEEGYRSLIDRDLKMLVNIVKWRAHVL